MSAIGPRDAAASARTDPVAASALQQAGAGPRRYGGAHLEIWEPTGVTLARLQSLAAGAELATVFAHCRVPLPERVNGCAGQDPTAICLAPGDWLLFSEYLDFARLARQLAPAIDTHLTALTDVSSACAVLRLSGGAAPWLLQKLCGLDVCGSLAAGRHAARTRLDHAAAVLHYHQPGSGAAPFVFDVVFERSLAHHLWALLLASAPHAEELHSRHGIPA